MLQKLGYLKNVKIGEGNWQIHLEENLKTYQRNKASQGIIILENVNPNVINNFHPLLNEYLSSLKPTEKQLNELIASTKDITIDMLKPEIAKDFELFLSKKNIALYNKEFTFNHSTAQILLNDFSNYLNSIDMNSFNKKNISSIPVNDLRMYPKLCAQVLDKLKASGKLDEALNKFWCVITLAMGRRLQLNNVKEEHLLWKFERYNIEKITPQMLRNL